MVDLNYVSLVKFLINVMAGTVFESSAVRILQKPDYVVLFYLIWLLSVVFNCCLQKSNFKDIIVEGKF